MLDLLGGSELSALSPSEAGLRTLLCQLAAVIVVARLLGNLARRLGQPRVVGEIVGGLCLGPSFLGALFPGLLARLFPAGGTEVLHAFSQVGLVLLMLQIGMEFDFGHLRDRANRRAVIAVAAGSILVPLSGGVVLGAFLHPIYAAAVDRTAFCGFVAVALSITALPILGRILIDLGLHRSRLGSVTISAAALNDVLGWLLLAAVSTLATSALTGSRVLFQWGSVAVFAGLLFLVRPWIERLLERSLRNRSANDLSPEAWVAAAALLCGLVTLELRIFAIFGGFLVGVLLYRRREFVERWQRRIAPFLEIFFLPVFFTFTGLRTDATGLRTPSDWAWCAAVVLVACATKMIGAGLAARFAGLPPTEVRSIAVMMNTRALMELVVLDVGHELGILPARVFTMLVLMAIASTLITGPALRRILGRGPGDGGEVPVAPAG